MGEVHYQRIARESAFMKRMAEHARRVIPKGSFHVPIPTVRALGGGDVEAGENVLAGMFKLSAPRAIHPHALRELGAGSIVKGRKVLQRFLDRAGAPPADQQSEPEAEHARGGRVDWRGGDVHYERVPRDRFIWQPDGNNGRIVTSNA
jgi:hypothetical protein